jgi:hypothetical protein
VHPADVVADPVFAQRGKFVVVATRRRSRRDPVAPASGGDRRGPEGLDARMDGEGRQDRCDLQPAGQAEGVDALEQHRSDVVDAPTDRR